MNFGIFINEFVLLSQMNFSMSSKKETLQNRGKEKRDQDTSRKRFKIYIFYNSVFLAQSNIRCFSSAAFSRHHLFQKYFFRYLGIMRNLISTCLLPAL